MLLNDLSSFLWKLFFSVCSLSPIFAFTKDSSYGFNSDKPTENEIFRFSLINLRLGFVTYYFFTGKFKICDKKTGGDWQSFSMPKITRIDTQLFAKITLENCQWNNDNNKTDYDKVLSGKFIEEKQIERLTRYSKLYIDELKEKKDEVNVEHKEFLCYLIDNERQRKNTATVKTSIYVTVLLVIIPLTWNFATYLTFNDNILVRIVLLLYFVIIGIMIFQSIKISSILRSTFGDLREATDSEDQLLYNYYYDWQSEKFSAQQAVGKVKVIEEYFMCTIVLLLAIMTFSLFPKTASREVLNVYDAFVNEVYTIDIDELEDPFSEGSIQYINLHSIIIQSKPECIMIFCNESDYFWVMEEFEKYDQEVRLIVLNDLEQQAGRMKIGIGD